MAKQLSDLITITPTRGGVEVLCELDTRHTCKAYFVVEAHGVHIKAQFGDQPAEDAPGVRAPMLSLRICSSCMVGFLGYVNRSVNDLLKS